MGNAVRELKNRVQAQYPDIKFSVRKTRNNGWVGQVVEIRFYGDADVTELYYIGQEWERENWGHMVEVFDEKGYAEWKSKVQVN